MSEWIQIKDRNDVDLSDDEKFVHILFETNEFGNRYIEVPIEFFKNGFPAELAALQERVEKLEKVLREIEYIDLEVFPDYALEGNRKFQHCPSCGYKRPDGHYSNCALADALGEAQ